MSRRRSTGDLVPRDITEILAREARSHRGQKKSGGSLGQAFGWFKGGRKKKSTSNGLNRSRVGVTDAKDGLQNHEPAKAGSKGTEEQKKLAVHYTTSQHYQENVFIEGSRPQYLEDLHTEAQEGLKILRQEEHKNGVNVPDDESIASTGTLRPEQEIASKDRGGSPVSRSASGSTDTTVISAVSTRPVLTRQGSTFKPLNPVKRFDRNRKRNRRTTIMGIPNQVQKELALHRNTTFQQLVPIQHLNRDQRLKNIQSGVVIIPTVDGGPPVANQEGARVHLSELETPREEQLLRRHLRAMYQDEYLFDRRSFGSDLCPSTLRPKSLAVPGMSSSSSLSPSTSFSFLQEPQVPVMSISPQATYLSTIIPNAVLPASVEVIEIDRSSSRTRSSSVNYGNSVRAVSKSSLESGDSSVSPMLSRRSEGDGSQTDNFHDSTAMLAWTSASNRSKCQSSKTVISNPSPVSSKDSDPSQREHLNGQESQTEQSGVDKALLSLHSSVRIINSPGCKSEMVVTGQRSESGVSGSVDAVEETKQSKQNFTRSLSVMKTRQPPTPPRRTNSLHGNKIRSNPRVLVESKDLNESASEEVENATRNTVARDEIKSSPTDTGTIPTTAPQSLGSSTVDASSSPVSPTQASSNEIEEATESGSSSPQKTPSEGGKFERTLSPSSGYSSQSGTPTCSPKGISPTSPDKQKTKPVKPERSVSRASSSANSPSSSLTSLSSGTSEHVNPDVSTRSPSLPPQGFPPTTATIVLAPNDNSSNLSIEIRELLNIPPHPKVKAPCPPPPETWVHSRRSFELLCGPCPLVSKARTGHSTVKQAGTNTEASETMEDLVENRSTTDLSESKAEPATLVAAVVPEEVESTECSAPGQETVEANGDGEKQEQCSVPAVVCPENRDRPPKKTPPPVMKKVLTVLNRDELVSTDHLPVGSNIFSSQSRIIVVGYKNENKVGKSESSSTPILSAEVPKICKSSPPPTPPPAYHPTPPLSRRTPLSSVSMPPDELQEVQEESHTVDSCWPPPPPPMDGDLVFDGGDEVDFPPPPPPPEMDGVPNVMDSPVATELVVSDGTTDVGEMVENSSEAGTSIPEQIPDVPPAVPQTATGTKSEGVVQVTKAETDNEISCSSVLNVSVSDCVPTPPEKRSPLPSPKASALESPSNFLRRDSLKSEDRSPSETPVSDPPPVTVPIAPPLPADNSAEFRVCFRRQPGVANRDIGSKELLSRHKAAPTPKEDANIPLVTPSLLQMVRLRSVNTTEDQVKALSDDKSTNQGAPAPEISPVSIPGPQNTPQKPIRKSLSLKSPPPTGKTTSATPHTPSMRLQEAIRMKTAAMSSRDGLPSRLGARSSTYSYNSDQGSLSPACTASFIFSRSTKRVVIETPAASSPEAQASLKQSLAAELLQVSEQSRAAALTNGGTKSDKVPPPVAKKPTHGGVSSSQKNAYSATVDFSVQGNREIGVVGLQHASGITPPETTATRVTADTIETLF